MNYDTDTMIIMQYAISYALIAPTMNLNFKTLTVGCLMPKGLCFFFLLLPYLNVFLGRTLHQLGFMSVKTSLLTLCSQTLHPQIPSQSRGRQSIHDLCSIVALSCPISGWGPVRTDWNVLWWWMCDKGQFPTSSSFPFSATRVSVFCPA